VTRCTFDGNVALRGAGMDNRNLSSPAVTDCSFLGNEATGGSGGGMRNAVSSSPTVTRCVFDGNMALDGGGMANDHASPTVTRCLFDANHAASSGGGMHNVGNHATVSHCEFAGNTAGVSGGGLESVAVSTTSVINCLFQGNAAPQGSAFLTDQGLSKVIHCTFSENTADPGGGALANLGGSLAKVANSILWNDAGGEIASDGSSSAVAHHNCIQGGYPGLRNIDADPRFVNPSRDDFHLSFASPCIDAGDNQAPSIPAKDWDGDPRVFPAGGPGVAAHARFGLGRVDMGVDEYCGITLLQRR